MQLVAVIVFIMNLTKYLIIVKCVTVPLYKSHMYYIPAM